jgi:hypothetical protein
MTIVDLERQRSKILSELASLGDMRSGSISVRYQHCGKSSCICHTAGHPGHGPIYSFSIQADGKTKIKNYKLGPELAKLQTELENYQRYKTLSQDLITVSTALCDLREIPVVTDVRELEELKKKLVKRFKKKSEKK